mgnify:FL=1
MIPLRMFRAVSRSGKAVEFVNAVGGMIGQPYKYRCATLDDAQAFETYCNKRDPAAPDMPIAVGPEIAVKFNAIRQL